MNLQSLGNRLLRSALVTLSVGLLAACGGGGDGIDSSVAPADVDRHATALAKRKVAPANKLQVGLKLAGFPHKVDVYQPAGATRVVVFLHGHGGRNWQIANDLGLNLRKAPPTSKSVNWAWLSANGIIAVFPQGQVAPGSTLPTWSNYVLNSGQDDVAFLQALAAFAKTQLGATSVSLAGHSSGGTMTARMWCEATTAYDNFVSLAGPMPSSTYPIPSATCTPLRPAPYFMIVGGSDTKLPLFTTGLGTPTQQEIDAGLTDNVLVSEWRRHRDRAVVVCGETPAIEDEKVQTAGPSWSGCGARIQMAVVTHADHPIASIEQYAGFKMIDLIAGIGK